MLRTTWDGKTVEFPDDTETCQRSLRDYFIHRLLGIGQLGPIQFLTFCGRRATVALDPSLKVDCPECIILLHGVDLAPSQNKEAQ